MKRITCDNCGGNCFTERAGYRICMYCNTRFVLQANDLSSGNSPMTLNADIMELLKKCQQNPAQARRYANLILDIDPTNKEALKYL